MSYAKKIETKLLETGIQFKSLSQFEDSFQIIAPKQFNYKLSQVMAGFGLVLRGIDNIESDSVHVYTV